MSNEYNNESKEVGTIWPNYRPGYSREVVKTCKTCTKEYPLMRYLALRPPEGGEIQDLFAEKHEQAKFALLRNCSFCGDTMAITLDKDKKYIGGK